MNFEQAEIFLKTADHLAYVTYPLMKDANLLKKIFENLEASIKNIFNFSEKELKEETIKKKFLNLLDENEIAKILEMLKTFKKKELSSMEFLRKNKIVLVDENLKPTTISLEELKEYIQLTKRVLTKLKNAKNLDFSMSV